jgi:preprotein translocase subunit SecB
MSDQKTSNETHQDVANNMTEEENNQPQAAIQKIYIKDVSFEAPNLPELFSVEYKPQIKMEMNSKSRLVAENNYEVLLNVTVNASQDDKTVFLVEVQQAGIFFVKNVNDEQLQHALSVMAPETLYPYAREMIASLIGKTGFPVIQLAPMNFQALFMQKLQESQEESNAKISDNNEKTTIQ